MGFILDFLAHPGVLIGGLIGIAILVGLHWFYPALDPVLGAIILVGATLLGFVVEWLVAKRR
jgi:hypothetical protein